MEKNTVWAVVLSGLVLIIFMFIQTTFFPAAQNAVPDMSSTQAAAADGTIPVINEAASVSSFTVEKAAAEEQSVSEETFVVQTNKVKVTLTNKGGDIIGFELMDHKDGEAGVQMADSISKANRAFALSFGGYKAPIIDEVFSVKKIDDLTYGFYKKFTVSNTDGSANSFTLVKQYTFNQDDYMFKLDIMIDGEEGMKGLDFNNAAYTLRTSPQIGPHFNKKQDRYETRTFMSYTDSKRKKQVLGDNAVKEYEKSYTWTGVGGKYFAILAAPVQPVSMGSVFYSTVIEQDEYANAQVLLTRKPIAQKNIQDTYYIYIGPRTEKSLKIYNTASENAWNLAGLRLDDSLESTGILSWLEAIMKWCMEFFYKLIPNWGVSIILMTILLKIVLFPLTKKSSVSTLKMQELQPQIKELQDKYKATPEKLNVEMAKLYKEAGHNPIMGCLPMLIQFPIIIAMFNLFNNYFEFRGAMFIPGWIPDLSAPDSIFMLNFSIPFLGNHIRILPVVYLISQVFFGKITQSNTNAGASGAQMKILTMGMPFFFFFIFYNSPSGLLIYWTISNLLQMVQQLAINKMMHAKKIELALNKGPEKPVFTAKKKKK
jgi:YidC/Oxa1 family membrane protein insertase